jgi:hypothetical protein
VVVDEDRGYRAPGVGAVAAQDFGFVLAVVAFGGVGLTAQVGQQVALGRRARAAADGVVGGAVERRVRGLQQREPRVLDGGLPGPGRAGHQGGVGVEGDGAVALEAAPVDQLDGVQPVLHGRERGDVPVPV